MFLIGLFHQINMRHETLYIIRSVMCVYTVAWSFSQRTVA